MQLESKTRKELQTLCKQSGVKNFWSWDKNKMIRAIHQAEFKAGQAESATQEEPTENQSIVDPDTGIIDYPETMEKSIEMVDEVADQEGEEIVDDRTEEEIEVETELEIAEKQEDKSGLSAGVVAEELVPIEDRASVGEQKVKEAKQQALRTVGDVSPQAKKWAEYFATVNTTAKEFLVRYPNHKFKQFISELA